MSTLYAVLIFASSILLLETVHGAEVGNLTCFACISSVESELGCLTNPTAQLTVECNGGYCGVQKMEMTETGAFYSFGRFCFRTKPEHTNDVVEDIHHISYHQCCRTSNCNIGDGKEDLGDECNGATTKANSNFLALGMIGFILLFAKH